MTALNTPACRFDLLTSVLALSLLATVGLGQELPRGAVAGGASLVEAADPEPADEQPPRDPFPIRRVLLTPEQLDQRVRAAQEPLVRMKRADFETKVRAVAAATSNSSASPELARTTYQARLEGGSLVGTGTWKLTGSRHGGALLLQPSNMALSHVKWRHGEPVAMYLVEEKAQSKGEDGIAVESDNSRLALLVNGRDDDELSFDWSSRGRVEPEAERFELKLPSSPVATLELEVPEDRTVVVESAQVLLSGPYPSGQSANKVWRISFAGQTGLSIAIARPTSPKDPPTLQRATHRARFAIAPGEIVGSFELEWESLRGPVTELEMELPKNVRVTTVNTVRPTSWQSVPPEKPGGVSRLIVRYRGAVTSGRINITTVSVFPDQNEWEVPEIRIRNCLQGSESLELRFDTDLKLEGIDPGDFRIVSSSEDRGYNVLLRGSLTSTERPRRQRPKVRASRSEPTFVCSEELTWWPGPGKSRLDAWFRVIVTRGPLSRLAVKIPLGYTLRGVTLTPDDPGLTWARSGPDQWVIEPSRPVSGGQSVEFRLSLEGPQTVEVRDAASTLTAPYPIDFPQIQPLGAGERDGTLTVIVPKSESVWVFPTPEEEDLSPVTVGPDESSYSYSYRGSPPEGVIYLGARPPRITAQRETRVSLHEDGLSTETRFAVLRQSGEVGTLTLYLPGEFGKPLDWELNYHSANEAVHSVPAEAVAIPLVAGWGSLLPVALQSTMAGGQFIQFPVSRPKAERLELTVSTKRSVPKFPELPASFQLPLICGAVTVPGPVLLDPSASVRYDGLPPKPRPTFPPTPIVLPPRGTLSEQLTSGSEELGRTWDFTELLVETDVQPTGSLVVNFSGRVVQAGGTAMTITLPPFASGAQFWVAGKFVDPKPEGFFDGSETFSILLPAESDNSLPFQVRYELPARRGIPSTRLNSPSPILSEGVEAERWEWILTSHHMTFPSLRTGMIKSRAEGLRVVNSRLVLAVGLIWASLLIGTAILLSHGCYRWAVSVIVGTALIGLIAWVLAEGWLTLMLPPILASLAILMLYRKVHATQPSSTSDSTLNWSGPISTIERGSSSSGIRAMVLLLLCVTGGYSLSQNGRSAVVYLVASPSDQGEQDALVPVSLVKRLHELTNGERQPAAVITAADYDVQVVSPGPAQVEATFTVWHGGSGEQSLVLPLAGAKLLGAWVNGSPGFPEAVDEGYRVQLDRAGWVKVRARFEVPISAAGSDREARFGCPLVPDATVRFRPPDGALEANVPTSIGRSAQNGDTFVYEHGAGSSVTVRWQEPTVMSSRQMEIRSCCLWEIGETESIVNASFVVRVSGGSVDQLQFRIPAELRTARPTVRAETGNASASRTGLEQWTLDPAADGWQRMNLKFQNPISGQFVVSFQLLPSAPLTKQPRLRFPEIVTDSSVDSYYALRFADVTPVELGRTGVIDYSADGVVREFVSVSELKLDQAPLSQAFRGSGNGPELTPVLKRSGTDMTGSTEVVWTVGQQVEAEGLVRLSSETEPISHVEFDLPPRLELLEVRGIEIMNWSRHNGRVQVWLKKPVSELLIRWLGRLADPDARAVTGMPKPVELPIPGGPVGEQDSVTIRVRSAEGWAVEPLNVQGLTKVSGSQGGSAKAQEVERYTASSTSTAPRFLAYPPSPLPMELLEILTKDGQYSAEIAVHTRPDRPTPMTLVLARPPRTGEAELLASPDVVVAEPEVTDVSVAWSVLVPKGLPSPVRLTLTVPLPTGNDVELPTPVIWFGYNPVWPQARQLVEMAPRESPTLESRLQGWEVGSTTDMARLRGEWPAEAGRLANARLWLGSQQVERFPVDIRLAETDAEAARREETDPVVATDLPEATPTGPMSFRLSLGTALGCIIWLLGLALLAKLTLGTQAERYGPERMMLAGALGCSIAGLDSFVGVTFALLGGLGLLIRLIRLTMQAGTILWPTVEVEPR